MKWKDFVAEQVGLYPNRFTCDEPWQTELLVAYATFVDHKHYDTALDGDVTLHHMCNYKPYEDVVRDPLFFNSIERPDTSPEGAKPWIPSELLDGEYLGIFAHRQDWSRLTTDWLVAGMQLSMYLSYWLCNVAFSELGRVRPGCITDFPEFAGVHITDIPCDDICRMGKLNGKYNDKINDLKEFWVDMLGQIQRYIRDDVRSTITHEDAVAWFTVAIDPISKYPMSEVMS